MTVSAWEKIKIGLFQLPREVAEDLPRLSLRGNDELTLGNHKGVVRFEPTILCVRTRCGEFSVEGENFVLESLGANLLLLRGKITAITCRECPNG